MENVKLNKNNKYLPVVCDVHWYLWGNMGGKLATLGEGGSMILTDSMKNVCAPFYVTWGREGWPVYMAKHGLLHGPGNPMCFLVHNGETVYIYWVFYGLTVMVDGGMGLWGVP